MSKRFDIGDGVRHRVQFKDVAGVLTDPDAIRWTGIEPDGTITAERFGVNGSIVKEQVGIYHRDIATDQSGKWGTRLSGAGTIDAAHEAVFLVNRSKLAENEAA